MHLDSVLTTVSRVMCIGQLPDKPSVTLFVCGCFSCKVKNKSKEAKTKRKRKQGDIDLGGAPVAVSLERDKRIKLWTDLV